MLQFFSSLALSLTLAHAPGRALDRRAKIWQRDREAEGVSVTLHSTTTDTTAGATGVPAPPLVTTGWVNAPDTTSPPKFGDGQVYVLGFTAFWCEGCPLTYGPLMTIAQRYASRGVHVLLVTDPLTGNHGPIANYFIKDRHVTLPVLLYNTKHPTGWPDDDENAIRFGVKSLPEVVLIDREGKIRNRWNGGSTDTTGFTNELASTIDGVLAQPR